MTDINIKREEGDAGGRYVTVVNGHKAEMTWSKAGTSRIIIDHTVKRAVEDARRDGIKIIPLCPFAKAQIEKHTEWQDILA